MTHKFTIGTTVHFEGGAAAARGIYKVTRQLPVENDLQLAQGEPKPRLRRALRNLQSGRHLAVAQALVVRELDDLPLFLGQTEHGVVNSAVHQGLVHLIF